MKWISWWFTFLVFIAGCIPAFVPPSFYYTHNNFNESPPDRVIEVFVSREISMEDTLEIQRAIDQWNFALNGRVKIEIVSTSFDMDLHDIHSALDENGWIIQNIGKDNPMVPAAVMHDNGSMSDTAAFVDRVGGNLMYLVRESMQDTWIYGIVLHEIGHLLGAEHNGKLLMAPVFNMYDYSCVDQGTMSQVARHLGLSMDQVNYCQVIN